MTDTVWWIEIERKSWGIWLSWRRWKGGPAHFRHQVDAEHAVELLSRVWPQHHFRVVEGKP